MKKIITALALLLFVGCSGSRQHTGEFITVDVTANYPKKEFALQDVLDVEYIPLETNDEFLTAGSVQDIGKDILVVKDLNRVQTGNIFIFDRKGKGLRNINRLGQGGEEYTNILGIVLDENKEEIYINNHFIQKVVVYDLSGNFKRSFKHREGIFYDQIGNLDEDHLICHDGLLEYYKPDVKRNFFLIVSKKDGSIKEISFPYEEKKSRIMFLRDENGKVVNTRSIYNKQLLPCQTDWLLIEPSADTIYRYSPDHGLMPFITRTPSVQAMDPEVFLFPGVVTDRYCFMQTVKKEYDFAADKGFPTTELVYDKQENAIFECTIYNDDFIDKKPMSLVYEIPIPPLIVNKNEIAFTKRLEAPELIEAYKEGQLKGRLKEIAAELDEESNPVIMLGKYKK